MLSMPGASRSGSGVPCVHSAIVFWLLFSSGQSSAEFLLACSGGVGVGVGEEGLVVV